MCMQNQDSHTKNQTSLNYGDYKTDELVFQSNRKELEHVININSTKIKYIYLNHLGGNLKVCDLNINKWIVLIVGTIVCWRYIIEFDIAFCGNSLVLGVQKGVCFVGTFLFCGFKRGICFVGTMLFVCTHYSKVFQVKCLYRS